MGLSWTVPTVTGLLFPNVVLKHHENCTRRSRKVHGRRSTLPARVSTEAVFNQHRFVRGIIRFWPERPPSLLISKVELVKSETPEMGLLRSPQSKRLPTD